MKLHVGEFGLLEISELYNGVRVTSSEIDLGIASRDNTLEVTIVPKSGILKTYRFDPETGEPYVL